MNSKQRGVLRGMLAGACFALMIVGAGICLNPFDFPAELDHAARLDVAMASVLWPVFFLAVAIGRLAGHRFFTPEDIDGGGLTAGTGRARLLQTLLQNTLEQCVLAFGVYCAWAVLMPSAWLSVVPMAALAFVAGRLLFFMGYQKGAPSRAFGFTLSFYPSLAMLLCIAVFMGARLFMPQTIS
mgnify:CR=1 FL=1